MYSLENELQEDYLKRINKVFLYIDENLDSDLSLEKLSEIAYFSPYHFHRIFKVATSETVNQYVTRKRIEKSACILLNKKDVSISELSLQNGFSSNSSFTRAFKKYYGYSPTEFKKQNPHKFSKIRQIESKNGQEYPDFEKYICNIINLKKWIKMNAKIEVKETQKLELAYVSSLGVYNLENAFAKLIQWATLRGLMIENETLMATIYHDSFKVTAPEKVRMSACMILNSPINPEGEVGLTTIEKGKCIVASFEIGIDEFEKSWTGLFIWMNENGYQKADRDPYEIYHNDFRTHPERKFFVDFYIPIK